MESLVYINLKEIKVNDWSYTVLQLCGSLGINISNFFYYKTLHIIESYKIYIIKFKNIQLFISLKLLKVKKKNVLNSLLKNNLLNKLKWY